MDQQSLCKKEYKISVENQTVNPLLNDVKCNTGIRRDIMETKLSSVIVTFYTESI